MNPYIGMIIPVAFNYPPDGWAQCDGQLLPINQYQALYALLGTRFGGDGHTSFALPDLRGRSPRGVANVTGLASGSETVTLTEAQLPSHSHGFNASQQAGSGGGGGHHGGGGVNPAGMVFASGTEPRGSTLYGQPSAPVSLSARNVQPAGGGQGHDNMQPYLAVNFIIALKGDFPAHSS